MTSSVLCAMTTSMGLSTGTLLCSSVRGVTMTTAKPAFRKHSKKGWMLPEFNLCFHARSHAFNTQSVAAAENRYLRDKMTHSRDLPYAKVKVFEGMSSHHHEVPPTHAPTLTATASGTFSSTFVKDACISLWTSRTGAPRAFSPIMSGSSALTLALERPSIPLWFYPCAR